MQAARGASLNSSDQSQSPVSTDPPKRHLLLFGVVAVLGYGIDLATKQLALARLEDATPVQVVGDVFTLFLTYNSGAAFSLGTSYTLVLSWIAVIAAGVTLWFARRIGSTGWAFALGFLLAGILGNLTDRIFRSPGVFEGAVVDFIAPKHFAVFNLADSAIVCGGILIVLLSFRGLDPDGTVHKD